MGQELSKAHEEVEKKAIEVNKLQEIVMELEKQCVEHLNVSKSLKSEIERSERVGRLIITDILKLKKKRFLRKSRSCNHN